MSSKMNIAGLEDKSIHLFATEEEAEDFIFDKLFAAGEIIVVNELYCVGDVDVS